MNIDYARAYANERLAEAQIRRHTTPMWRPRLRQTMGTGLIRFGEYLSASHLTRDFSQQRG